MASNRDADILLKIGADTENLSKDLNSVLNWFHKLDKNIAELNKKFLVAEKGLDKLFSPEEINAFNTALMISNKELDGLARVLKTASTSSKGFTELRKESEKYGKEIENLKNKLAEENAKLAGLKQTYELLKNEKGKTANATKEVSTQLKEQKKIVSDLAKELQKTVVQSSIYNVAVGETAVLMKKWASAMLEAEKYVAQLSDRNKMLQESFKLTKVPVGLLINDIKRLTTYLNQGAISEKKFMEGLNSLNLASSGMNINAIATAMKALENSFTTGTLSAENYKKVVKDLLKDLSVSGSTSFKELQIAVKALETGMESGIRVTTKYRKAVTLLFNALMGQGKYTEALKLIDQSFSKMNMDVNSTATFVAALNKSFKDLAGAPKSSLETLLKLIERLSVSLSTANVKTEKQRKKLVELKVSLLKTKEQLTSLVNMQDIFSNQAKEIVDALNAEQKAFSGASSVLNDYINKLKEGSVTSTEFIKQIAAITTTGALSENMVALTVALDKVNRAYKEGLIDASEYKTVLAQLSAQAKTLGVSSLVDVSANLKILDQAFKSGAINANEYVASIRSLFTYLLQTKNVGAAMNLLNKSLKDVSVSIDEAIKLLTLFKDNFAVLGNLSSKDLGKLNKVLDEIISSLNRMQGSTQKETLDIKELSNAFTKLKAKINGAADSTRELTAGSILLQATTNKLEKVLTSFGEKTKTLFQFYFIRHMLFSTYNLFRDAISMSMKLEQQLTNIAAIMNLSGAALERINKRVLELSLLTGRDFTEIAGAFETVSRAGLTLEESLAAVTAATQLSVATMSTMDDAVNTTIILMKAFNLSTLDAGKAIDTVTTIVNKSRMDLKGFNDALKYVGAISGLSSVSIKEMASALGVLADSGLRAQQAGVYLRSTLSNLLSPSTKFLKVVEKSGLTIGDISLKYNSLATVLSKLREAFSAAGDAQDIVTRAFEAGQRRTAQGLATLLGLYDKFIDKLKTPVFNTTAQMLEKQTKTITVTFSKLLKEFQINIVGLVKNNKEFVKTLFLIVDVFNTFVGLIVKVINPTTLAVAAIGYLTAQVWKLHTALKAVVSVEAALASKTIVGAFLKLITVVGLLAASFVASGNTMQSLTKANLEQVKITQQIIKNYDRLANEILPKTDLAYKTLADSIKRVTGVSYGSLIRNLKSEAAARKAVAEAIEEQRAAELKKLTEDTVYIAKQGDLIKRLKALTLIMAEASEKTFKNEEANVKLIAKLDSLGTTVEKIKEKIKLSFRSWEGFISSGADNAERELGRIIKTALMMGDDKTLDSIRKFYSEIKDMPTGLKYSIEPLFNALGLSLDKTKDKIKKFNKALIEAGKDGEITFFDLQKAVVDSGLATAETVGKMHDLNDIFDLLGDNGDLVIRELTRKIKYFRKEIEILKEQGKKDDDAEIINAKNLIDALTNIIEKKKKIAELEGQNITIQEHAQKTIKGLRDKEISQLKEVESLIEQKAQLEIKSQRDVNLLKTNYLNLIAKEEIGALKQQLKYFVDLRASATDIGAKEAARAGIIKVNNELIKLQAQEMQNMIALTQAVNNDRQKIVTIDGQILQARLHLIDANKEIYSQGLLELNKLSAIEEYMKGATAQAEAFMAAGQYEKAASIFGQIASQAETLKSSFAEGSHNARTLSYISEEYYEKQIDALEKVKQQTKDKLEKDKLALELQKQQLEATQQLVSSLDKLKKSIVDPDTAFNKEKFMQTIDDIFGAYQTAAEQSNALFEEGMTGIVDASMKAKNNFNDWVDIFKELNSQASLLRDTINNINIARIEQEMNTSLGSSAAKYHSGGFVSASSDETLALLQRGEYVIPRDVVKQYGVDYFEQLRKQKFTVSEPSKAKAKPLGTVVINVGQKNFPVQGEVDILQALMEELEKQRKMRGM